MSHDGPDHDGASGFSFDVLRVSVATHGTIRSWGLAGRSRDGRSLLLELAGVTSDSTPPALLHAARLRREDAASTRGWMLESSEGRFDAGPARLFVHEDVAALAATAIPPRAVPLGKRLMWRAVFALLATSFGRRWLARRAGAA